MLVHTIGDKATFTGSIGTSAVGATGEAHIKRPVGAAISAAVTWTNATTGAWSANFPAADIDQPGDYYIEVEVLFSGETEPQTFALDAKGRETRFLVRNEYA